MVPTRSRLEALPCGRAACCPHTCSPLTTGSTETLRGSGPHPAVVPISRAATSGAGQGTTLEYACFSRYPLGMFEAGLKCSNSTQIRKTLTSTSSPLLGEGRGLREKSQGLNLLLNGTLVSFELNSPWVFLFVSFFLPDKCPVF